MNNFTKAEDGFSSETLLRVRLMEIDRRFRSACCRHYQDLILEALLSAYSSTISATVGLVKDVMT
jgi:hypothetical protein